MPEVDTPENKPSVVAPKNATKQIRRVFVGLNIVPDIACELARLARGLECPSVKLVAPSDLHLTLVPPWSENAIPDVIAKLDALAGGIDPLSLTFEHVGYGPQPRRPRLLWADCTASEELAHLQAALMQAFGQTEERPFRPHVTIARIRGNGSAIVRHHPIDQKLSLTQLIKSVELFQSPPPGTRGYQVLASCRLGEATKSPPKLSTAVNKQSNAHCE